MSGREINRIRPEKPEEKSQVRREAGTCGAHEFSWASCLGLRPWHQAHLGLSPGSALIFWVAMGSCLPSLSVALALHKELPPGVIVDGSYEPRAFHLTLLT